MEVKVVVRDTIRQGIRLGILVIQVEFSGGHAGQFIGCGEAMRRRSSLTAITGQGSLAAEMFEGSCIHRLGQMSHSRRGKKRSGHTTLSALLIQAAHQLNVLFEMIKASHACIRHIVSRVLSAGMIKISDPVPTYLSHNSGESENT
jgi:hypothetical protein